ncbi:MAG: glycosyltransferase family 4 protein [Lachnospiraceae bacterium]|nr:glycosyltransferase family 4 protein [Lachnospiraceae bacterium]
MKKDVKVLMIGAGRDVQGGVSTVVNQYYECGLDNKVNLTYLPTVEDGSKLKKLIIAIKSIISFRKYASKYDVVHVHMASRASFHRKSIFIKYAKKINKRIIIHMHGAEFDIFYENECNAKAKEKIKSIFSLADKVVVLSEEWKEFFSKICNKEKIMVLYNAVKITDYYRNDYIDKNILFLGRLGKRKGTYDILEAIPKVIKEVEDVHFYFAGDGELDRCRQICEEKGIASYVTFLGWIKGEKKDEYLKKCSTYLLPSYNEGMPMSVLEAMSYGNIVIASDIGGISKIIQDGENGYLIRPGDVDGISDRLISTLKDINRSEIGNEAYNTISNKFNLYNNIDILTNLYLEVANK